MALLAVLSVLIIGGVRAARRASVETENRNNAKSMQAALESYYAKNKSFCTNMAPPIPVGQVGCKATAVTFGSVATGVNGYGVTIKTACGVNGGGWIQTKTDGYLITPYDFTCSGSMTSNEIRVNW